jgi:hypothetical protein
VNPQQILDEPAKAGHMVDEVWQRLLPAGWPDFSGEEAPKLQGASVTVSDQMPTKATSGRFDTEP